jgi:predicted component of type VI protein secretion system
MRKVTAMLVLLSLALAGCGKTNQESKPYTSSALDAIQNPVQEGDAASAASAPRK